MTNRVRGLMVFLMATTGWGVVGFPSVSAHCDAVSGPVVTAAKSALATDDVAAVLMWVKTDGEKEIRDAFARTMAVRTKGPEARELADMYFFETVVRVHRRGEGEPYTGLKPAGTDPGPAVAGGDKALATGSLDALLSQVNERASSGMRERFRRALDAKAHAGESVEAGRKYVEAYVEFLHFTERLFEDAGSDAVHHDGAEHVD